MIRTELSTKYLKNGGRFPSWELYGTLDIYTNIGITLGDRINTYLLKKKNKYLYSIDFKSLKNNFVIQVAFSI